MTELLPRLKRWLNNLQNLLTISCYGNRKNPVAQELSTTFQVIKEKSTEKLNDMLRTLRRDIKEAFYYLPRERPISNNTVLSPFEKVSLNLNILEETMKQALYLKQSLTDGYEIDRNEILMKCKTIISIINCLRDDVFQSYLELSTSEKLALHQKDRQMSNIFTVLGMLETEVTNFMKSILPTDPMTLVKPLIQPAMLPMSGRRRRRRRSSRRYSDFDTDDTAYKNIVSFPVRRIQNYCRYCRPKEVVDVGLDPIEFNTAYEERASGNSVYITPAPSRYPMLGNIPDNIRKTYISYTPNDEHITPIINQNIKFNSEFLDSIVERNKLPTLQAEDPGEYHDRLSSSITDLYGRPSTLYGGTATDENESYNMKTARSSVHSVPALQTSHSEVKNKTIVARPSLLNNQPSFSSSIATKLSKNDNFDSLPNIFDTNNKQLTCDWKSNSSDLNLYLNDRPTKITRPVSLWHESANQLLYRSTK